MDKLNDVCTVITCGVAKRPNYTESGVPFLSSKNVKENKFILKHYNYVSEKDFKQLTKYNKPEKGDILYTRVGSYGEAAIVDLDFEFAIFVSLTLIKPNPELVFNRYLMYYLNSPKIRFLAENSTSGIGVKNLNVGAVREFPINLPPLKTQQKIAAILDEADKLRQLDKELLQKYEDLGQSLFLEMFGDPVSNPKGWETKSLKDVLKRKSQNGYYAPKNEYNESGIKMLHMSDAFKGIAQIKNAKRVLINPNIIEKYSLDKNDLLIARRSLNYEGAAKPCLIPDTAERLIYESSLIRITPNPNILNTSYLFYLFNNHRYRGKYILKHVTKSTISGINNQGLNSIDILVPPLGLQNRFESNLSEIKKNKTLIEKSLKEGEQLFNSLLQKAFKGELV